MNINELIERFPILNINDVVGWTHSNPLGVSPLAVLLVLLMVIIAMHVCNILIRQKNMTKLYPVAGVLLLMSIACIYYYAYMPNLPQYYIEGRDRPLLSWYAIPNIVGWGWTVVGIVLTAFAVYAMIVCVLQMIMHTSEKVGVPMSSIWNTSNIVWLVGLMVFALSLKTNAKVSTIVLIIYSALIFLLLVAQIIVDARKGHWAYGVASALSYLIAMAAIMVLALINANASLFLIIVMVAAYTSIRAKKTPRKRVASN